MLINTENYNYQDDGAVAGMFTGTDSGGSNDVYASCRHYAPTGAVNIINMENYTMCDSCRHKRMDDKCGVAEKTLM